MTEWKILKMKRIRRSERAVPIGEDEVVIQRIQFSAVGSKQSVQVVRAVWVTHDGKGMDWDAPSKGLYAGLMSWSFKMVILFLVTPLVLCGCNKALLKLRENCIDVLGDERSPRLPWLDPPKCVHVLYSIKRPWNVRDHDI